MKKLITAMVFVIIATTSVFAKDVEKIPIISSCVTVNANTTYTAQPQYIAGYNGYIGYSFTAVDASGGNFAQTNAYLVYQVWDDSTTGYTQGIPNTSPVLYGANGFPATSAWQITGNTQSPSNVTAKKSSIQCPVSRYITWSIINLGGTGLTVCTLNMVAQ
ncbi:MAG: hypothetical protein ACP5JP_02265 [bacterium]